MRTATVKHMRVLDSSGHPWRPTMDQYLHLEGDSPYKGASYSRRAGALWNTSGGSADADFLPDANTLRARSREQARNNPLAAGALLSLSSNVIGDGLQARPQINRRVLGFTKERAKEIQLALLTEFNLFAESNEADLTRRQNFYGLQNLAFNSAMESGDVLTLLPAFTRPGGQFLTKVQLIEADRVANEMGMWDTDRLVGGVELDANAAPLAYHVRTRHPGDRYGLRFDSKRVAAFGQSTGRRNAWLLGRLRRPGQTRSEPYFTTVLEHFKQLERYTDAELHASVVGGSFTVFVTSPTGEGLAPLTSVPLPTSNAPLSQATDIALDYGAVVDLLPGEDIKLADPKRPNQAFGSFVEAIIKQIAAGLGLPFELLLRHFTASYSASRGALLEAWKFFRALRSWFASNFCNFVYETVITESVLKGTLDLPGFVDDSRARQAYLGVLWLGPAPGQLNPEVEITAAEKRIAVGVSNRARETAEISGEDWEDVHEQLVEETNRRRADGLEPALQPAVGASPAPAARRDPDKADQQEQQNDD